METWGQPACFLENFPDLRRPFKKGGNNGDKRLSYAKTARVSASACGDYVDSIRSNQRNLSHPGIL
jgi:hypothetical protein